MDVRDRYLKPVIALHWGLWNTAKGLEMYPELERKDAVEFKLVRVIGIQA